MRGAQLVRLSSSYGPPHRLPVMKARILAPNVRMAHWSVRPQANNGPGRVGQHISIAHSYISFFGTNSAYVAYARTRTLSPYSSVPIFMDELRPKLDSVLHCLSLNNYSVFSLINDILTYCDWEDERIELFLEGMERDAPDICALLRHIPSGSEGVLDYGRAQRSTCSRLRVPVWPATSTELPA